MGSEWLPKKFGDLVCISAERCKASDATLDTYISTENMLSDFGGVTLASSLPVGGSVTRFRAGDTLFSNIRTYFRKVWKAEFDGQCSNDVLVLRPRSKAALLPSYLHHLCRWQKFTDYSVRTSKGAKMPRGDKDALAEFDFLLPALNYQCEVSEFLDSLDDRIDTLRQTNATLESIAQALFKSWFVDFDPVRAKAEGREPEGMDAATAALFPSEFEDSELGPVPKGWQVDEIGELVDCLGGATPSTKDETFWDGGVHHWATPKDLSGLGSPVLLDTGRKLTDAGVAKISSGLLPAGTLLMSSRAPIGYLAIAAMPVAVNQGFIAMPPGGRLSPTFLLFWCQANMDLIKQSANGSTFMEISKKAFRPLPVRVPPQELLLAFERIAGPLITRIMENARHRVRLKETRNTLLPRLVSGQLGLPEFEDVSA